SGDVRIDGTLSTSISVLDSSADEDAKKAGLDLTATFPTTGSSTLPDWFKPTDNWSVHIEASASGVSASVTGNADITISGTVYPVSATVGLAWDGTDATFSLKATLGTVDNLFGQSWL